MQNLDMLNQQFAQGEQLVFVQQGELIIAQLMNDYGRSSIALQGAQVLSWLPKGEADSVIWVSDAAVYQTGKGVRGGVPVCWPWFGAGEAGKPAHGFVRTRLWQVVATAHTATETSITLRTEDDDNSRSLWNHRFTLELTLSLGADLSIHLATHNTGDQPMIITEALHTYFAVGDLTQMQVIGLDGVDYLDKVQAMQQFTQVGAIAMAGEEVDRIYLNTLGEVSIDDQALARRISITKSDASATVVWNPGVEKEKGFADMAAGDHRRMLCVESGTAGNAQITIAPQASHCLKVCYQVAKLA
jgi:D-hexose-6-phosphate mutarotase